MLFANIYPDLYSNTIMDWPEQMSAVVIYIFSLHSSRSVRRSTEPFGGIQLIVCGDFLQLPPVAKGKEKSSFCFQVTLLIKCL